MRGRSKKNCMLWRSSVYGSCTEQPAWTQWETNRNFSILYVCSRWKSCSLRTCEQTADRPSLPWSEIKSVLWFELILQRASCRVAAAASTVIVSCAFTTSSNLCLCFFFHSRSLQLGLNLSKPCAHPTSIGRNRAINGVIFTIVLCFWTNFI